YLLDGTNILKETVSGAENYVLEYLYDESGVAGIKYNGAALYFIKNLQGDVIALTDDSAIKLVQYTYDAWGNVISITGGLASLLGNINPIRYRGYYYDTDTGYYYLNSRYYDPTVGRFLNGDAFLGINGGIVGYNLFAYCNNNLVCYSDNSGCMLTASIKPMKPHYPDTTERMGLLEHTEYLYYITVPEYARGWTSPIDHQYYHNDVWFAAYGAPRDGGSRRHKGVDYYPYDSGKYKYGRDGTAQNVYAVYDGVVVSNFSFYAGMNAVVIDHGGVFVLYGEISSPLKVGDTVEQGQLVGTMKLSQKGTLMLHLEVFVGEYGKFSRNHPNRVDPTFTYSLPDSDSHPCEVQITHHSIKD
ncbi:MAG: peptidoglycan DD-metalloendopeptidase family protein, partial [Clostridia bacterium]|nr:peptidoglycan DD-metalloendopeptidase family protein [Clostridia bacterium]